MLAELLVAAVIGALCFAILLKVGKGRGAMDGMKRAMDGRSNINRILRKTFSKGAIERPKVVVTGPKVKPVVCQICLGRVKEGTEYAKCTCGKTFHPVCLIRTGFCPYCEQAYTSETLSEAFIIRPKAPARGQGRNPAEIRIIWQSGMTRVCPVCGAELAEGSSECQCGAIVVEEGETFDCPSCGTEVPPSLAHCPTCHERFDVLEGSICQVCGRVIADQKGVCDCGALTADLCPECGAYLEPDDVFCGSCGTAFELV